MTDAWDPGKSANEIWSFVTEIGKAEREFNSLQAGYRKLASTWLLAVFAGLGYVLKRPIASTGNEVSLVLDVPHLVFGLGVAGYFGILVLWAVDVVVYHKLLLSYFEQGYKLETMNSWLPQVRHRMAGAPAMLVATGFYVALATAAFAASWLVLSWSGKSLPYPGVSWMVGILDFLVIAVALCMRSESLTSRTDT